MCESVRFDPDFHIYLCFGQSNMQGKGIIWPVDRENIPERFLMMAAVDFPTMDRRMGEWYPAVPPLCREDTGLGIADYFGRELTDQLPEPVRVGVINCAVDGCRLEIFDEDCCESYIQQQRPFMQEAAAAYGNNPFRRLVNLAKKAQAYGVVKGILMHQGESNCAEEDWMAHVQILYNRILAELGLEASRVPLIAGEMVQAKYGGVRAEHIPLVRKLPRYIPNCVVVSSDGCLNMDKYHFNSEGYRIMGRRYAQAMLRFLQSCAE